MTDDEIRELLQGLPEVSGWRPRTERAWLRTGQPSVDLAEVDEWVTRSGGRIEEHQPSRTLPPYPGQPPIPTQTLYILPRAVLDNGAAS
jgi:hypothetical protein